MHQVDKPWFRLSAEWMATSYKYFLRRDQIKAAELVIHGDQSFKDEASYVVKVTPEQLFDIGVNCTDADQMKKALHSSSTLPHVKRALHHVVKVLKKVRGTDSERSRFLKWFQSFRIAHGAGIICSR